MWPFEPTLRRLVFRRRWNEQPAWTLIVLGGIFYRTECPIVGSDKHSSGISVAWDSDIHGTTSGSLFCIFHPFYRLFLAKHLNLFIISITKISKPIMQNISKIRYLYIMVWLDKKSLRTTIVSMNIKFSVTLNIPSTSLFRNSLFP